MTAANRQAVGDREHAATSIFVVDDEPMLLELALTILSPLGYAIRTFRDPGMALRTFAAASNRPALLITDYSMHEMTGMDLTAACRRVKPGQKVLMVSGTVDERVFKDAPEKPDNFLMKPYRASRFLEVVKKLLEEARKEKREEKTCEGGEGMPK